MTKGVKICLAAVITIFAISAITAWIIVTPKKGKTPQYVEIVQENRILYRIDLRQEKDRTFRIEYPDGGWNDITIENSRIFVSDADCPDKTCVESGELRNEHFPIICLPHKLVIRFSEQGVQNENKTTD